MIKYLLYLYIGCCIICGCRHAKQTTVINNLVIDPTIKTAVEKHIEDATEFDAYREQMDVYANALIDESYINDRLTLSSTAKDNKQVFKSFYLWHGDTLLIEGAYGLFGGIGFAMEITKHNATLYHMLSADDFPCYSYTQNDTLLLRLQIPCTGTKMIVSQLPDSANKQIIYGYVEFNSASYYASTGSVEGQEILPRNKQRDDMKIYFRSHKLHF